MERLCVAKEGPGRGGDTGVMDTLAVDELVSMEWSDVQDDDSESCNEREKSGYTQLHTKNKYFRYSICAFIFLRNYYYYFTS